MQGICSICILNFPGLVLTCMFILYRCKVAKEAPYAIFKSLLPYNTSDVSSKYGDSADRSNLTSSERPPVTESPAISPPRKSSKRKHRCGPRVPARGDTFYLWKKGRRCKTRRKPSTVAPAQVAPISRARTTTPSKETARLNATNLKKRVGNKKRNGKGLLVSRKQSRCCGFRRADTLRPHCKRCPEQETTTGGAPIKVTVLQTPPHRETTDTPEPDNLKIPWNTTTLATTIRTKLKTTASLREDGTSLRQMGSHLLGNNTSQQHMGSKTTQSTLVGISFKENNAVTGECMHLPSLLLGLFAA